MQKASANLIKDLKKQKRSNTNLLFLDNPKIIIDAVNAGHKIKLALTTNENKLPIKVNEIYLTDYQTIEALSDVKTPQGVCVVLEYIQHIAKPPQTNFLVLDGLQDPGNVGTLIRTAMASGFNDIYLIESVKETNSKMIRSTAGACFNVNLYSMTRAEFISKAQEWNLHLIKADMNGTSIFEYNPSEMVGVVVGNEGNGVSSEVSSICKDVVKIPMKEGIESLNAGVSGAIIMYEINKNKF